MRVIEFCGYLENYLSLTNTFFYSKDNFLVYKFLRTSTVLSYNFLVRKYEQ